MPSIRFLAIAFLHQGLQYEVYHSRLWLYLVNTAQADRIIIALRVIPTIRLSPWVHRAKMGSTWNISRISHKQCPFSHTYEVIIPFIVERIIVSVHFWWVCNYLNNCQRAFLMSLQLSDGNAVVKYWPITARLTDIAFWSYRHSLLGISQK
jgi:hypothetical protein